MTSDSELFSALKYRVTVGPITGTRKCYNALGQLHCEEGPAVEYQTGGKVWYRNGMTHREDGPAIEWSSGTKEWCQNNQKHRVDGPAIEWNCGTKEWWQNDQRHREDGPAIERTDGTKEWYQNGERHNSGYKGQCAHRRFIFDELRERGTLSVQKIVHRHKTTKRFTHSKAICVFIHQHQHFLLFVKTIFVHSCQ